MNNITVNVLGDSEAVEYRYGAVEDALAKVLSVSADNLKAFRARIRHLRNIGTPAGLPATGKGPAITYKWRHIFELLMALELQTSGMSPRHASLIAGETVRQLRLARGDGKQVRFAVVTPQRGTGPDGLELPGALELVADEALVIKKLAGETTTSLVAVDLEKLKTLLTEVLK